MEKGPTTGPQVRTEQGRCHAAANVRSSATVPLPRGRSLLVLALLSALTVAAFLAVTLRLRLEPNVASLLPERGESAALRRYVRAFGGGDLAVVMVKGPNPDENAEVA